MCCFIKIEHNKEDFLDLLLIADPNKEAIMKYLDDSELFVLQKDGLTVCAAAIIRVSEKVCELKNIACHYIRRGYGSKMINFLVNYYSGIYEYIIVGTADISCNNINFYIKNGFHYTHTVKDFFILNYEEPVYENGVLCKNISYYKRKL